MMRKLYALTAITFACCLMLACQSFQPISKNAQSGRGAQVQAGAAQAAKPHDFARWESAIAAFEKMDRTSPPPKGTVLFTGSSTITRWKTVGDHFPGVTVINRGFGGCQIEDCMHFAERYIFPLEPRIVVLCAGSNDISAGKTAEHVFRDYVDFAQKVHARLPKTKIVFVSLNPRPSRWEQREANKEFNKMAKRYAMWRPWLDYVETYDMTIDEKGQPRMELFVADKLHFNDAGNKLLADRIRPYVK